MGGGGAEGGEGGCARRGGWWWWGGGGGATRRVLKRPAHNQANHGSSFILLLTASFVQAESATTRWSESAEKGDLCLVRPEIYTLHAVASLVIPAKPTLSEARFPSVFRHPSSRNLTEVRMSWTSAWEFGQQWPSAPHTQK